MKTLRAIITFVTLCFAVGIWANDYTIDGNYVTVKVKHPTATSPKLVRLQIINDKIVRVESTPENAFPNKESLIIVPQQSFTQFSTSQVGENVEVVTKCVYALVNTSTGRVQFFDKNKQPLLKEVAQGGQVFTPYTVPEREIGADSRLTEQQKHGWTWNAVFESPADEAFYGLGQHQSEELNMKGKNEELFQYNTKVSVPFVISNKNYGVLWDSY